MNAGSWQGHGPLFCYCFQEGTVFLFWKKEGRCVALMCLAAFLQGMVFYAPVAALYRTQAGVSLGQIALNLLACVILVPRIGFAGFWMSSWISAPIGMLLAAALANLSGTSHQLP